MHFVNNQRPKIRSVYTSLDQSHGPKTYYYLNSPARSTDGQKLCTSLLHSYLYLIAMVLWPAYSSPSREPNSSTIRMRNYFQHLCKHYRVHLISRPIRERYGHVFGQEPTGSKFHLVFIYVYA